MMKYCDIILIGATMLILPATIQTKAQCESGPKEKNIHNLY